jgi:acetyl esterase/lipase
VRREPSTTHPIRRPAAALAGVLALVLAASGCDPQDPPAEPDAVDGEAEPGPPADEEDGPEPAEAADLERLDGVATAIDVADFADEGFDRWQQEVPTIEDVSIASSVDDHQQPALWLPPGDDDPAPLLVVLHSWSTAYQQHQSIPFAQLAEQLGWAAVFPDFRGTFDREEAGGSDLAVQDVVDAIDWAGERADIDEDRVFVTGFSGGGMMTLLMAGRHPDRFAGAVAWVPVYDLIRFHAYSREHAPEATYPEEIETLCGGDPTEDEEAEAECLERSPVTHLGEAADRGLPIYLGHGIDDDIVRPDVSLQAFNQLAHPDDRVDQEAIDAVHEQELPADLAGSVEAETHFAEADPEVRFARRSGPHTVVLFDGEHDMVYHPTIRWLSTLPGR